MNLPPDTRKALTDQLQIVESAAVGAKALIEDGKIEAAWVAVEQAARQADAVRAHLNALLFEKRRREPKAHR